MFTGIIQAIGRISNIEEIGGDARLHIGAGELDITPVTLGDSIAVNGVCLTVVALNSTEFAADVSRETLGLTTLGGLEKTGRVNLEPALTLATPLGGHLVSGHVDGVGQLLGLHPEARSTRMEFTVPDELAHYIAKKGSVTIDGTSLTVNDVSGSNFSVNIVPHTLERTIMGNYSPQIRVNIEVDLVARYLERLLQKE
jgi:riboflavin synthase